MPDFNIDLSTLPGLKLGPAGKGPRVQTAVGRRDGSRAGDSVPQGVIFQGSFDSQPDWVPLEDGQVTRFTWNGDDVPSGWSATYNKQNAFPAKPNIRIGDNPFGTGKALICTRENSDPSGSAFGSNGVLGVLFDQDYDALYIEFDVAFASNWTSNDSINMSSKIFRAFCSDRDQVEFWSALGGHQGPLFLWSWEEDSQYGVRNLIQFRGGPPGENYQLEGGAHISGLGRLPSSGSLGDVSMNWTSDLQGNLTDGSSPQILDKLNGGFLPSTGAVWHPQVFGTGGTFNKMGFYLKMNSAPGIKDGLFRQYFNDQLIVDSESIMWVPETINPMPGWNAFSLGGNDKWFGGSYTESNEREEEYAFSNILVSTTIPERLL